MHARVIFLGGWINWRIVSDVYIFIKGKSVNAVKNENVELTNTRILWWIVSIVRITVTKIKLYWCHGYLLVQNADVARNMLRLSKRVSFADRRCGWAIWEENFYNQVKCRISD